jgi:DNA-binding beta-propeller fold protein YncE
VASEGAYLLQFGSAGSGPGEFNQPANIAIDSADNIYVADSLNHRVQKFDSDNSDFE